MLRSFGDFQFDDRRKRLTSAGRPIRLSGQALELLSLLLDRPGELISREEIQQKLWPDSHVEFEHSLDVIMSRLRLILGEDRSDPRYIETVPRKGYRFIERVSVKTEAPVRRERSLWTRRIGKYAAVALLAAMIAILIVRSRYDHFVPRQHPRTAVTATPK
jgi:DNA-binding winged helix-turn-helix (wHTH) protein